MLDPVIKEFLVERKKGQNISDQEILERWLPGAAQQAKQLFLVSHPGKFTHPDAKVSPIFFEGIHSNDGLLRTGNAKVEFDTIGNAAAMGVYKFLNLVLEDGRTILSHLENDTKVIKEQLTISAVPYKKIREELLLIKAKDTSPIHTSNKVKQVFVPVYNIYHLLSILTNSGLMFKLKEKINKLKFSAESKEAREAKKKGLYHGKGYSEMYNLSMVGFGGTQPQNISALNSKFGGKAFLLLSMPPELKIRSVQPPREDFFKETLWLNSFKYDFIELHEIFIHWKNNIDIRIWRDELVKDIIYQATDKLWAVRQIEPGWSNSDNYRHLPKHQKIWLDQMYESEREPDGEWLKKIKDNILYWFLMTYKKVITKNPIHLEEGKAEILYLREMIDICEEVLI